MPSVDTLKELTPFLSVLVALIAVFLGPFLSAWVARRQIVAPIRQKWIDELRDLIAEFLSTARMTVVVEESQGMSQGILNKDDIDKETYKKMLSIERKLTLMLNPNEMLHNDLMKKVRDLLDQFENGVPNVFKYHPLVSETTEIAQKILKEEWVRVKKGKV